VVVAWLYVCFRQRSRTSPRDHRGEFKPRSEQASTDMRTIVPLLATIGFFLTFAGFCARSASSAYTLWRLDFDGDGYCGVNAIRWGYTSHAPQVADFGSTTSSVVATPPPPVWQTGLPVPPLSLRQGGSSVDNLGCTGGVPQGFMYTRMLGDMLVVGWIGSLAVIEVSGRSCGRPLAAAVSFVIFVLALVKFCTWQAFLDQMPESAACPTCPSFFTILQPGESGYMAGQTKVVLGRRCSNTLNTLDRRPFQSSFVHLIFPSIMVPTFLIMQVVGVNILWSRFGGLEGAKLSEIGHKATQHIRKGIQHMLKGIQHIEHTLKQKRARPRPLTSEEGAESSEHLQSASSKSPQTPMTFVPEVGWMTSKSAQKLGKSGPLGTRSMAKALSEAKILASGANELYPESHVQEPATAHAQTLVSNPA